MLAPPVLIPILLPLASCIRIESWVSGHKASQRHFLALKPRHKRLYLEIREEEVKKGGWEVGWTYIKVRIGGDCGHVQRFWVVRWLEREGQGQKEGNEEDEEELVRMKELVDKEDGEIWWTGEGRGIAFAGEGEDEDEGEVVMRAPAPGGKFMWERLEKMEGVVLMGTKNGVKKRGKKRRAKELDEPVDKLSRMSETEYQKRIEVTFLKDEKPSKSPEPPRDVFAELMAYADRWQLSDHLGDAIARLPYPKVEKDQVGQSTLNNCICESAGDELFDELMAQVPDDDDELFRKESFDKLMAQVPNDDVDIEFEIDDNDSLFGVDKYEECT